MDASQPSILIVDDTPANLKVLSELLKPRCHVRAASSGRLALQSALKNPPDLILLDVKMPDMDGYAVLSELLNHSATSKVPVIFVTAMADTEDEEHGLDCGAVDYITKPIRPAIVLARVRAQLELKRARDFLSDHNSYLEAEIDRRLSENQLIQEVSIHALARLAETRDPETGNHLRRTQEYVRTLAKALKNHPRYSQFLDIRTIHALAQSAPLHDIGKVGIPDHILLKPGKLTPDEWEIMKTHAELGSKAIEQAISDAKKPVEFLSFAQDIAHYHHEKWDGSGYPLGLAGDEIPIAARLMALADVFDALICQRVYKPPFPVEEARRIIHEGRGKHFDPAVVDAFQSNFERFVSITKDYTD